MWLVIGPLLIMCLDPIIASQGKLRLSANVGVDYEINDSWSTGASYTFSTGGYFRVSQENSYYNGVNRKIDAFVKWKLNKETTVRFVVRNLLAQDGIFLNRYADGNGATNNQFISPSFRQAWIDIGNEALAVINDVIINDEYILISSIFKMRT